MINSGQLATVISFMIMPRRHWSMVIHGLLLLNKPLGSCSMHSLWQILRMLLLLENVQRRQDITTFQLSYISFQDHGERMRILIFLKTPQFIALMFDYSHPLDNAFVVGWLYQITCFLDERPDHSDLLFILVILLFLMFW